MLKGTGPASGRAAFELSLGADSITISISITKMHGCLGPCLCTAVPALGLQGTTPPLVSFLGLPSVGLCFLQLRELDENSKEFLAWDTFPVGPP